MISKQVKLMSIWDKFKTIIKYGNIKENFRSTLISPFGLYSKPKPNSFGYTIDGGKFVIPLTNPKDIKSSLKYGDVLITDYKSFIHFNNATGEVTIKANKLIIDSEVSIIGSDIKHKGVSIGMMHKHITNGIGSPTTPPQG